jgi:hypothetical protein
MANNMSDYAEDKLLNLTLRNTAWAAVAQAYVALHASNPGDTGAAGEITALAGYARQAAAFDAPSGGVTQNTAAITFGPAGEAWGEIGWVSIWDALSGGNCLYVGAATAPLQTIANGNEFVIDTGDLVVTAT